MANQKAQQKTSADISFGEALLSSSILKKKNKLSTIAGKLKESHDISAASSDDLHTMANQKTLELDDFDINFTEALHSQSIKKKDKPSTSADDKQKSHDDSIASSNEQNDEKYLVGDIVWAKIGRYPFWPSIVCIDPDSKIYMKGSPKDKKKFSLHVRFCNDNGRRSWAKVLSNYSGKNDLLTKYPNCLSYMKNSKKQMNTWNLAVEEADNWLKFDREERWIRFASENNIKSPVTTPIKSNSSSSATVSNKSPDSTNTTNSGGTTQKESDCFSYSNTLSDRQLQSDVKKRKIIKKKTVKNKIINPLNNLNFTCPEESYHIDENDDASLTPPTHRQRKVMDRLRFDVERLEAEGIRKIREWNASKLARAAKAK